MEAGAHPYSDAGDLSARKGWPLTMAFHSLSDQSGVPSFEMWAFQLDNGVAPSLRMDFGDFSGIFQWGDTLLPDRWEEGMEIYFEKGRLRLDLMPAFLRNQPARVELYKDNEGEPGQIITPTPDWTWAFRREDEAFIADVAANREPLASGADSLEDMRLLDDIWKHIAG